MRGFRFSVITLSLAVLAACNGGDSNDSPTPNAPGTSPSSPAAPAPEQDKPVSERKDPPASPSPSPRPLPSPFPSPSPLPSPFPNPGEHAFEKFRGEYDVLERECDAGTINVPGTTATDLDGLKVYSVAGAYFLQKEFAFGLATETLADGVTAIDGSRIAITGTGLTATRTASLDVGGISPVHRVQVETLERSLDGSTYEFTETIDETAWYGNRHSACRYVIAPRG